MTHADRIIEYIRTNGSITPMEAAWHLGIIDLARDVSYMRKHGYNIKGTPEKGRNRFGDRCNYYRYSLEENDGERQMHLD